MTQAGSTKRRPKPRDGADFGAQELQALGRELRRLREQRGWSLRKMSTESGISVAAIQNIESGSANPSLLTVLRLAEVLGQVLDRLVAAAREAVGVVNFVSGSLPRSREAVADLTGALNRSLMRTRLITVPGRQELVDPGINAPLFAYLLEGSLEITFADGQVERLRPNDAIHVLDRFPKRLNNPLARRSRLLCFTDLRGEPPLHGHETA